MVGVNVLADRGRAALFTVPAELNVRDNAARTTYEGSCGSAGSAGHCGRGPGRSPYSNLSHSSPAVPPLWPDRDLRHVGTTQSAPQATRSPESPAVQSHLPIILHHPSVKHSPPALLLPNFG